MSDTDRSGNLRKAADALLQVHLMIVNDREISLPYAYSDKASFLCLSIHGIKNTLETLANMIEEA